MSWNSIERLTAASIKADLTFDQSFALAKYKVQVQECNSLEDLRKEAIEAMEALMRKTNIINNLIMDEL